MELLVVVFVVGLIVSLVVTNIDRDGDNIAQMEATRFAALIRHVQDESILAGYPMGIQIDMLQNRYRFSQFKKHWQLIDDDEVLRDRVVPKTVTLKFTGNDISNSDQENTNAADDEEIGIPDIILEPNGLINVFELTFSGDSETYRVLPGDAQEITVEKSSAE